MNRDKLVQIIDDAEKDGANVYVDKITGIATSEFYRTEITRLDFDIDIDFHKLETRAYNANTRTWEADESKTVYSPKVNVLDRIADCAGITFVKNETNEIMHDDEYGKHTAFISNCIGRKLMSDGNYKDSSMQIYEFDPLIQAMSENTEEAKIRRKALEYRKNAAKRAETGARLRVIRELVGLPQGFPKSRAEKYFVVGRIVPNLKEIASTKQGRALAECKALGIDPAILLYGARQSERPLLGHEVTVTQIGDQKIKPPAENAIVTSVPETPPQDWGQPESGTEPSVMEPGPSVEPDFPEYAEDGNERQDETEFSRLTKSLNEYLNFKEWLDVTSNNGINPYKRALAELGSETATEESRRKMINRIRDYLIKKNVPGVA